MENFDKIINQLRIFKYNIRTIKNELEIHCNTE